ncbi:unnamed protein product, partial [marine sediment metagenome]
VISGIVLPIVLVVWRRGTEAAKWQGELGSTVRGLQHQLDERKEEDEALQQGLRERRQAYDVCREEIRASLAEVKSDLRIVRHDVARLVEKNGLPPSGPGKEE